MRSKQEVQEAIDKVSQQYGHVRERVSGNEFITQMVLRYLNPITEDEATLLGRFINVLLDNPEAQPIGQQQVSTEESATTMAFGNNDNSNSSFSENKQSRPLTFAEKLRVQKKLNRSLKRKVRKEANKISELNRLTSENDKMNVDLMELLNGKLPLNSPAYTANFKAKRARDADRDRDRDY